MSITRRRCWERIALIEHGKALVRFLTRKPNAYHEEAVQFLADAFDVKIHQSTISRALKKLGIVRYHQRKPVPGENEEGGAKWLPGPGPRPSTLVDVRSIDPALQNMTPSCAPHPSEIQRPLGFPTQPRTPLESDNPQPSQNLRPPENQHPPSQIPRAPELQRTPENYRNGNTTTGIANNNTQENLLPILQSDVLANAGGNT